MMGWSRPHLLRHSACALVVALGCACGGSEPETIAAVVSWEADARDVASNAEPDDDSEAAADVESDAEPDVEQAGSDVEGCLPAEASCRDSDVCCGAALCGSRTERCAVRCETLADCESALPECYIAGGCNSAGFCSFDGPFDGPLWGNPRFDVPGDCRVLICSVYDDGQTFQVSTLANDDDTPAGLDAFACTESLCEEGTAIVDRPNNLLCDQDENPLTRERCVPEEGGCVFE
jgi:hypothetical protein